MDAVVNQLARELSDAIGAAVAGDAKVEAVREKARAAGFELRVSLEAAIGFAAVPKTAGAAATGRASGSRRQTPRAPLDITANDRRFLKSLRIASDEPTTKEAD